MLYDPGGATTNGGGLWRWRDLSASSRCLSLPSLAGRANAEETGVARDRRRFWVELSHSQVPHGARLSFLLARLLMEETTPLQYPAHYFLLVGELDSSLFMKILGDEEDRQAIYKVASRTRRQHRLYLRF